MSAGTHPDQEDDMNFFTHYHKLTAAAAVLLSMLLLALTLAINTMDRRDIAPQTMVAEQAPATNEFSIDDVSDDVLWLARVIYSETKRPYEQELVAWVIRNRVETAYRGKNTYQNVVLDPWQFSAFNKNGPKRGHYMNLTPTSKAQGWATALEIAHEVYHAAADVRPFDENTRHFYSEISMVGKKQPDWAKGKRPVNLDREIDPRRFRFYRAIA
jgi:hypothetical protein